MLGQTKKEPKEFGLLSQTNRKAQNGLEQRINSSTYGGGGRAISNGNTLWVWQQQKAEKRGSDESGNEVAATQLQPSVATQQCTHTFASIFCNFSKENGNLGFCVKNLYSLGCWLKNVFKLC